MFWVPEGSLAGFVGCVLRSGRPRGPGKAFQNVGGEAPQILDGFPGTLGPARPQECIPQKFRPDCLQVPSTGLAQLVHLLSLFVCLARVHAQCFGNLEKNRYAAVPERSFLAGTDDRAGDLRSKLAVRFLGSTQVSRIGASMAPNPMNL